MPPGEASERYVRVCEWANRRYRAIGVAKTILSGGDTPYGRILDLAWERYSPAMLRAIM